MPNLRFTVGDLVTVLLTVALIAVGIAIMVLPDPAAYPTDDEISQMLASVNGTEDAPLITPNEYFHQPILITDSIQLGSGESAWNGLCNYLGTTEQADALYTALNNADAIQDAIEKAELEMIPSVIILCGNEAAKTVKEVQELYAGTYFLLLDAAIDEPLQNVCCMNFATEQAGFIAGYAAAMEGYERIAFVAEERNNQTSLYEAGFYQGADIAAQHLDRSVHIVSQFGGSTLPDAEVAFVCGSVSFETNFAKMAQENELPLIGTQSGIKTADAELVSKAFLGFVTKNYAPLVETGLNAIDSGAWEQFYSAQSLRFDLQWGDVIRMDNEHWTFRNFTPSQYQQILANIANDASYYVEKTIPEDVLQRVGN